MKLLKIQLVFLCDEQRGKNNSVVAKIYCAIQNKVNTILPKLLLQKLASFNLSFIIEVLCICDFLVKPLNLAILYPEKPRKFGAESFPCESRLRENPNE